MLDQSQIDFYKINVYLSVPDIFSSQEVTELRSVTDCLVQASKNTKSHTEIYDLEPDHSVSEPRVRRIKSPHKNHKAFDHAVRNSTILDIVEQLIGTDFRLKSTKLNMKSANYGSAVEWHQDWAFYPHTNDDILAVGIAIDDMTEINGCLLVVPGSHLGKVYDHHEEGFFVGAIPNREIPKNKPIQLTVMAGGITIHHVRTLHGSAPNTSTQPRRFLLSEICSADAWPLNTTNCVGYDEMNTQQLRGKPILPPRMKEIPVRIPQPAYEEAGSIYELHEKMKNPFLADPEVLQ